jgi:hypothetical protein
VRKPYRFLSEDAIDKGVEIFHNACKCRTLWNNTYRSQHEAKGWDYAFELTVTFTRGRNSGDRPTVYVDGFIRYPRQGHMQKDRRIVKPGWEDADVIKAIAWMYDRCLRATQEKDKKEESDPFFKGRYLRTPTGLYTIADLSQITGIKPRKLQELCKQKKLSAELIGGTYIITDLARAKREIQAIFNSQG